ARKRLLPQTPRKRSSTDRFKKHAIPGGGTVERKSKWKFWREQDRPSEIEILPEVRVGSPRQTQYQDGRFCTAGSTYFVIVPSGDVFRCMTDVIAATPPIFNIRDGWKILSLLHKCGHRDCVSYCDRDQASKWNIGKNGQVIETNPQNYFGKGLNGE